MSGIAAIFHRDGRPARRDDIERVARALTMYGPEQQRVRVEGPIAFAYTHFTNTPEARGQYQPLVGSGGRHIMVFDGRLDNRDDLGSELRIDRPDLRLISDAALALRCWERWGTAAFNRWIGEFSLIVWDNETHRLIAARHQFGYRTLHYHISSKRIVIASAPKGIHALSDIPRAIDEQKIADVLGQHYCDSGRGYFQGVHRVPPACFLEVGANNFETHQYYKLEDHICEVRYASDDDYIEAARELLDESVNAMLRTPGPVGAFMSGGLDSSTVAVTATRLLAQRGKRLPTFTSVPEAAWDGLTEPQCYGDETPYVKAIADQHDTLDLNLIDANGLGHYYKQEEFLHAAEMPVRNALNMTWFHAILSEAQKRSIKVMLEGTMGNLTLSYRGDGVYTSLWQKREYRRLLHELSFLGPTPISFTRGVLARLVYPLGPDWLWTSKEWIRGRGNESVQWLRFVPINPDFARDMKIAERAKEEKFSFFYGKPPARARDFWNWMLTRYATADLGDIQQGLSAQYGIELRDPFSSRKLIEWSLGVPEEQFHRNGQGRWLIKRLMNGALPDSVLFKPKDTGRQAADWHARLTRDLPRIRADLKSLATDPDTARMIDIARLQSLLDDWPSRTVTDRSDDRTFFLAVNLPMALQVGRFVRRVKGVNEM